MAKKFLYMSSEGYAQEQSATDDLELGSLSVSNGVGTAVAIDGADKKITGLVTANILSNGDAANKEYVDGAVSGAQSAAETYADTNFLKLDGTNPMGAALDMDSHLINNLSDPVSAQDAATKAYVDSVAQGLDPKEAAEAVATSNVASLSGPATIDGVSLTAEDRVLLTNQTSKTQNGIWIVKAGAWARPADFAAGSDAHGAYILIADGSVEKGSGWVCTSPQGGSVVGTDELTFSRFLSAAAYTASHGAMLDGLDIQVSPGAGLAVDSSDVYVDLEANSALSTSSGKLAFVPDTARALAMDASGAYVKIDTAKSLAMDSSNGIQLKTESSQAFSIDSTNGLTLDIDATLAKSGGLSVKHSPDVSNVFTAAGALEKGMAVFLFDVDQVFPGDPTSDTFSRIVGVSSEAVASGDARIVSHGACIVKSKAAFQVGDALYMGLDGRATKTKPTGSGNRVILLGYAMEQATAADQLKRMWVEIKDYGRIA